MSQWFLINHYQEHELGQNTGLLWSQMERQREKRMETELNKASREILSNLQNDTTTSINFKYVHAQACVHIHSCCIHALHDKLLWWSKYRVSPQRVNTVACLYKEQTVSCGLQHMWQNKKKKITLIFYACHVHWTKCSQWISLKCKAIQCNNFVINTVVVELIMFKFCWDCVRKALIQLCGKIVMVLFAVLCSGFN